MRKTAIFLIFTVGVGVTLFGLNWAAQQENATELLVGAMCLLGTGGITGILIGSLWTAYLMRSGARLGNEALYGMAQSGANTISLVRDVVKASQLENQPMAFQEQPFPRLRDWSIDEPVEGDYK